MRATRHVSHGRLSALIAALSISLHASASAQLYVPDEVLVRFKADASISCRDSALAQVGGTIIDSLTSINYYVVQLADTSVLAAVSTLAATYCVHAAQTNGLATDESPVLLAPNDSLYATSDYLHNTGQNGGTAGADIDAEGGWNFIHDSPNVIIGILDTGIDYLYGDLVGNIWTNPGETPGDSTDNDSNGFVDDVYGWDFVDRDNVPWDKYRFNGHGTGTAGRAAARTNNTMGVSGVTWSAKLMALRVVNAAKASATEDSMVKAVEYAVRHGAKVLNVSLTYSKIRFGTAFRNALIAAGDSGLVITCGSGNSGLDNDIDLPIPSTIDAVGLIAVGGVNRDDVMPTIGAPCYGTGTHPISNPAIIPNYGATTVDMAAPACNMTTMYAGIEQYNLNASGTSGSAPQVAGAAALLFAQNPSWTNVQVKSRLMATIDTLASCVGKMVAPGRLNLDRALDNVRPSPVTLTVESVARWSQSISWTDTGDDSTWGQSRAYVLKRSTSPISNQSQFNAATTEAAGTPGPNGTYHCLEVDGLSQCTTYYWSMQLEDNALNVSNLATAASATTTCSGNTYVVCDGGGLLQGGDGGGGGGGEELSRQFPGSEYRSTSANSDLGPAVLNRKDRDGWIAENRIQSGSGETSLADLIEMREVRQNHDDQYLARVLQAGSGMLTVSRARLGFVDRPSETKAVVTSTGVAVGREVEIAACRLRSVKMYLRSIARAQVE